MEDVWVTFQEESGLLEDTIEGIRKHLESESFDSVTLEMYKNRIQEICMSRIDDDMTEGDVFDVYCKTFEDLGIKGYFIRNCYLELFYLKYTELSLLVLRNTIKSKPVPFYAIGVAETFKRLEKIARYAEDKSIKYEVAKIVMLNVRALIASKNRKSPEKLNNSDYRNIIKSHFMVVGLSGTEYERVYLTQLEMTGKLKDIEYDKKSGKTIHPEWVEVLTDEDYYSIEEMNADNNFNLLAGILINPVKRGNLPSNIEQLMLDVINDYEDKPISVAYNIERRKKIFGDAISVVTRNDRFYGSRGEAIKRFASKHNITVNRKLFKDSLQYVRTGYTDFTADYDYDDLYRIISGEIVKVLDYFEDNGRTPSVMGTCIKAYWFDSDMVRLLFRDFAKVAKTDRDVRKIYRENGVQDGYIIDYEIRKFIRNSRR